MYSYLANSGKSNKQFNKVNAAKDIILFDATPSTFLVKEGEVNLLENEVATPNSALSKVIDGGTW